MDLVSSSESACATIRSPEPLDHVKSLVCERCWKDCFDTDGFERFGRREVEAFSYTCIRRELLSTEAKCTWCSFLLARLRHQRGLSSTPVPEDLYEIVIRPDPLIQFTPTGSNLYHLIINEGSKRSVCHRIGFLTDANNFASHLVTARKIKSDVSPSSTCKEISQWFSECATHSSCPEQIELPLPTRVIDVTALKIKESLKGERGLYATLSYCWGTSGQVTLSSSSLESAKEGLDFDSLPKTIQDAIEVTRSLSIRYLWVDALCIIQDDVADKTREISGMARVYGNAHITIVALTAWGSSEGFLQQRLLSNPPGLSLPFRVSPDRFGIATLEHSGTFWWDSMALSPVNKRAWTLQEQLLSRRLLLYSDDTLRWRCAAGTKNLGQSLHIAYDANPQSTILSQLSTDPKETYQLWLDVLRDYCLRSASVHSDKLPAVSALAQRLAPSLGKYYAGIWSYGFVNQLLWGHNGPLMPDFGSNPNAYRAPSWSWASTDGSLYFPISQGQATCTLISADTVLKDHILPYGEVLEGSITLRAKLLLVWIDELHKCSMVNTNYSAEDSTMTRFFKNYFTQSFVSTARAENSELPVGVAFDQGRVPCHNGLLYFLPISMAMDVNSTEMYNRYRPDLESDSEMPLCEGIVLVPVGPHTVRRIGHFNHLHQTEFMHIPDQDITIV